MNRDQCLQQIHYCLSSIPSNTLRIYCWYDFRYVEKIQTSNCFDIAVEALMYLSLNSSGNWNRDKRILQAILAFLHELTGIFPRDTELLDLKTNLETQPVDRIFIADWFHNVYSELAQ